MVVRQKSQSRYKSALSHSKHEQKVTYIYMYISSPNFESFPFDSLWRVFVHNFRFAKIQVCLTPSYWYSLHVNWRPLTELVSIHKGIANAIGTSLFSYLYPRIFPLRILIALEVKEPIYWLLSGLLISSGVLSGPVLLWCLAHIQADTFQLFVPSKNNDRRQNIIQICSKVCRIPSDRPLVFLHCAR